MPSYPVLTAKVKLTPFEHTRFHEAIKNDFSPGRSQRFVLIDAQARADGKGGVSSYSGANRWKIGLQGKNTSSQIIRILWDLYQTSMDGGWTPFWFYNPEEVVPSNLASLTGTYDRAGIIALAGEPGLYQAIFSNPHLSRTALSSQVFASELEIEEDFG